MNKSMEPPEGNSIPGVARLYFEVAIGATGAVGTVTRSRGLASAPSRASAGLYTWLLAEGVQAIVAWELNMVQAAPTGAVACVIHMKTRTPGGATPGFVFQVVDAANAAIDPANGDSIVGFIDVKVTSA